MNSNKKFFDFKNMGPDQKKKIFGYIFIGIVALSFVAYGILSNEDETVGNVDDFSNPQAELIEYNNKSDAINKREQQYSSSDLTSIYQSESTNNASDGYVNFDVLDQQIASATKGNNGNSNSYSQQTSTGSSPYNSHSTYGDYSMWQAEEPQNNSVGYSSKTVPVIKSKKATEPLYTEIPTPVKTVSPEPVYQNVPTQNPQVQKKPIRTGKQIRAKLLSQGYVTTGRSISFVLLEATKVGDINIPKGQTITGISSEQNNRLMVNFSSLKFNNKLIPVQMELLGTDGLSGLPIGGINSMDVGAEVESKGRDFVSGEINRIPVIGRVIGGVVSGGNRTNDNRIKLTTNIECIIVNYN